MNLDRSAPDSSSSCTRQRPAQGTDRAAFLDETCAGDSELRQEVESLLAEEPWAERFLATPALAEAALVPGTRVLVRMRWCHSSALEAWGRSDRARDTRLKRDVALKVLPAALASDADRLASFQREAEVLATLNHPNIATD